MTLTLQDREHRLQHALYIFVDLGIVDTKDPIALSLNDIGSVCIGAYFSVG